MDKHPLFELFHKVHRLMFQHLMHETMAASIHPGQFPILRALQEASTCSQAYLSKILCVSPATVAVSLKRLEKQGYITRQQNPANLRENLLSLTEDGFSITERFEGSYKCFIQSALQGIPEPELVQATQVLQDIYQNIKSIMEPGEVSEE